MNKTLRSALYKKRMTHNKFLKDKSNKNCLWWPCLLTDQNGMSNSHQGPSIDASYHVSINKYGCHRQFLFLIGWFLKIFSSETALPNEQKLGRKVLYKEWKRNEQSL
jgi:hypothetical protein